jgi:hypothetical protein
MEMEMEMGWRVEERVGRGSKEATERVFQRREERVREKSVK